MDELILMILLAIVQAITEWLPISSSGHLVLFQQLFSYNPGLSFDIALHFGSVLAVIIYFYKDIFGIVKDFCFLRYRSHNFNLGLYIIIATIPAGVIGLLFRDFFESTFSSMIILSLGFLISALVLFLVTLTKEGKKEISFYDSILIGISQIFAIFSSISRSGITLATALLLGVNKKEAVKFSFLMAIPVILGASLLEIYKFVFSYDILVAVSVSFIFSLAAIHLLIKIVLSSKKNLRWFALYLLLLSLLIFIYLIFYS